MADVFFHPVRTPRIVRPVAFLPLIFLFLTCPAFGGVVHPLQGGGNFHSYVDVVNRWQDDGSLDVLVMIEVTNADLAYDKEDRGYVGRLLVEVEIESSDGEVVREKRSFHTPALSHMDAASSTLFQNFGLVIKDVPFRSGRFNCVVNDVNQRRVGFLNALKKRNFRSECSADWFSSDAPYPSRGVSVGDPLFLFLAPLDKWNPNHSRPGNEPGGWLLDYMHPSRRYGIEQDKLQVFFPIWPPAGGVNDPEALQGLVAQVFSFDTSYSITDTLEFDQRGRDALEAGLPAGLFYTLDVNLLPEGSFRLGVAPLGGEGRGLVSGFDVIWRLDTLGRHRNMVLAEGNLVFEGSELRKFLDSSPAEQERMLDEFWDKLNPDPESPVNSAYLEFQYRMGYVQQFLGGFNSTGPNDDRGLVFILMGPADEVQSEKLPMNFRDQDDARIKVYKRFAPDRESVASKGTSLAAGQSVDPYDAVGGIPMPYSKRAQDQRKGVVGSPTHGFGFELWTYDTTGRPLYENRFSRSSMGMRFLFVDRSGTGDFFLESSNVVQGEE